MARWIHFRYNSEKGRYERRKPSFWRHIWAVIRHLMSGIIVGAILVYIFVYYVGSPSEWRLEKEHEQLQQQYALLDARLDEATRVLADIGERDDNLYRVMLQGDPVGKEVRNAVSRNMQRYDSLMVLGDAELYLSVAQKMDVIERQLYLQSRSFDELVALCQNQEDRLKHIPSIQPVSDRDLKQMASGFGWREDPIYHVRKHHDGMDFSASTGTDVFVTGDGKVISSGFDKGYGLSIVVDHGYGYTTRYAHMSKLIAKKGNTVHRGDKIGEVGSTGKSTGPHLHYEVHYRGAVQNPANYYFMDLTPEQYEEMVQKSENIGQVMD